MRRWKKWKKSGRGLSGKPDAGNLRVASFASTLFSIERCDAYVRSICINRDFTVPISAIDPRTDCVEPSDDIRCWMTEWVAATAADQRDLWTPGLQ